MGSCWSASSDVEAELARRRNGQKTVYHRSPVDNNVQIPVHAHVPVVPSRASKACYGEYTCPRCGHSWHSILSWPNVCQACRKCKTNARPRNQREVRSSDITRRNDYYHKHPQELCQRCQQLGYQCSNSIKKYC
ncbi:unnamed protein product [Arctia plantaginis]|uniref:3CxxC-type domain-containing protein n=1 Tax=Arctia plantaginis TaxID=874455 RepID=A0A8S1ATT4_ARCPL|nr:unnamed protein product [Arctia plantaginis]